MRIAILLLCLVLIGCTNTAGNTPPIACPQDAKICPDGSTVVREGSACAFPACPESDNSFCDYGSPKRDYKGKSVEECSRIKFSCPQDVSFFSDHCGCGCTVNYKPVSLDNSKVTNT